MELDELEIREGGYFKLHGFMVALVLDPVQYFRLLDAMRERLPAAERRAQEFYAVNPSASEVLREVAAKLGGVPLEDVPDLGGHKNDRLRPRGSGKA